MANVFLYRIRLLTGAPPGFTFRRCTETVFVCPQCCLTFYLFVPRLFFFLCYLFVAAGFDPPVPLCDGLVCLSGGHCTLHCTLGARPFALNIKNSGFPSTRINLAPFTKDLRGGEQLE